MNYNLRICFAVVMIVFMSCKKEQAINSGLSNPGNAIKGTWELRKDYGAMLPPRFYDAGNGNTIQFKDSTYQFYVNGQSQMTGSYKLITDTTGVDNTCLVIAENFKQRIVFDGNTNAQKVFVNISGTKLSLLSGCFALDAGWGKDYEMIANK